MKQSMTGDKNPNYKNAGWKICKACGKKFHNYQKTKYCSSECYNKSDEKKENCRRANDRNRRSSNYCETCGISISYTRKFCEEHNPNGVARIGHCLHCGKILKSNYDVLFCKECRSNGAMVRVVYYSTCEFCGTSQKGYKRKYCDFCWHMTMTSRRDVPRKVDANQAEIFQALRAMGCSIIDTSSVGGGFPDAVIGYRGINYLMEIKNPATRGKLNELQKSFFASWNGQASVIHSAEDAVDIMLGDDDDEE